MMKMAMLSFGEKKTCAYKEQYPGASQQNIVNYFYLQSVPCLEVF
jgi:hypothetical protein